jgi:hypothetical protein
LELPAGEREQGHPPSQGRLEIVVAVSGPEEALHGLRPLSAHLPRVSENPLDPWVSQVLRRQLGGLQHRIRLATGHQGGAVINQQIDAGGVRPSRHQMPHGLPVRPPPDAFLSRPAMQLHPLIR